jgi:hypothetical protein
MILLHPVGTDQMRLEFLVKLATTTEHVYSTMLGCYDLQQYLNCSIEVTVDRHRTHTRHEIVSRYPSTAYIISQGKAPSTISTIIAPLTTLSRVCNHRPSIAVPSNSYPLSINMSDICVPRLANSSPRIVSPDFHGSPMLIGHGSYTTSLLHIRDFEKDDL